MKKTIIFVSTLILIISPFLIWEYYPNPITLKQQDFNKLPGWQSAQVKKSFEAFKISCATFLRQNPERSVGSQNIPLKVKDWLPACKSAVQLNPVSETHARQFFQKWFTPVEFYQKKPIRGLFTGYYLPLLHGSKTKTSEFSVPIYGLPKDLLTLNLNDFSSVRSNEHVVARLHNNKLVPYYTRKQINHGAISDQAPVIVWVNSYIDRLFLEIQGSGVVALANGEQLFLGYAGENGAAYTPIARVMIKQGVMTRKNASMQGIKTYLLEHPQETAPIIDQNKSFVFFRVLKDTAALGAQGVTLTPGYSLAVDRKWIPLGMPLWLNTTHPQPYSNKDKKLQRLMIAQDTGGAIRGKVRGDVFWGAGDSATFIAGKMKNTGRYWLLVPRHCVPSLAKKFDLTT